LTSVILIGKLACVSVYSSASTINNRSCATSATCARKPSSTTTTTAPSYHINISSTGTSGYGITTTTTTTATVNATKVV
jgi:hypothetical protein